jgi:hypothetical protein
MLCVILSFVVEQHLKVRDPLRQRAGEGFAVRVLGPKGCVSGDSVVGHVCFGFGSVYLKSNLFFLTPDFKIKTLRVDLANEGRFDFWISNFKFQKRFLP